MSVQKSDHPSVGVMFVGVEGTGKTSLFMSVIARVKADWVLIYDHKDGDMEKRWRVPSCSTPDDLLEAVERGDRTIIFNPHEMFPDDSEAGFAFWSKFVWEVFREVKGVKLFIADELDSICKETCKPREAVRILSQGRTYQFDCYFMGTAMNAVHNGLRKSIKEIFAFRQGDENAINFLHGKFGRGAGIDWENLPNGIWHYKNTATGEYKHGGKAFVAKGATRDLRGL